MCFEFTSVTFIKEQDKSDNSQTTLIGVLVLIILSIIAYIASEFNAPNWTIYTLYLSIFIIAIWIRFKDFFKPENITGKSGNEIRISKNKLVYNQIELEIERIKNLQIELKNYKGQLISLTTYEFRKADGVSNKISFELDGKVYSEYFKLYGLRHYHDMRKLVKEMEDNGVEFEFIDLERT